MKVLITGADGFMGKNLYLHLSEQANVDISVFVREDSEETLRDLISKCDFIFHLAGVNRPQSNHEFAEVNTDLTTLMCQIVSAQKRPIPIVYTSSIQAELANPYGQSKKAAEKKLESLAEKSGNPVYIYRLPNVFGKWAQPNYNSVVATFCYNTVHQIPLTIHDKDAPITLVYIDDVIKCFMTHLTQESMTSEATMYTVTPEYSSTIGDIASKISAYNSNRDSLVVEEVGTDLDRALYATYLSYIPKTSFGYPLKEHTDNRGRFVEMLKTKKSGQFSFFTAHPGVTRGGHYHHTKSEKFLVISGQATFHFRHVITQEYYDMSVSSDKPMVVETIPGWTHDITNTGTNEMVVLLWANEIFDASAPDTYPRLIGDNI